MKIDDALLLIREIPDYPKPGIRFQDITPLLAHGEAFIAITEKFATYADSTTLVAGEHGRLSQGERLGLAILEFGGYALLRNYQRSNWNLRIFLVKSCTTR